MGEWAGVEPVHTRGSGKASLRLSCLNRGPEDVPGRWGVGGRSFQSEGTACVKTLCEEKFGVLDH